MKAVSISPKSAWIRRVPLEIWDMIWSLVPPEDRVLRMWMLVSKSSFFADLFIRMPTLWMHWFLKPYTRNHQDRHAICAIRMWCHFHGKRSTSLPISIYAVPGSSCIHNILDCVPFAALPFIRHVTLRVSESILHCPVGFPEFLASLSSLRSVWLNVYNGMSHLDGGRYWVSNAPLIERDLPPSAVLRSLCLDGLTIEADAVSTLPLSSLYSLSLIDLAKAYFRETASLVDILARTPHLTTLRIRSDDGQPPPPNFWPCRGMAIAPLLPQLCHLELSGDALDLYPFLETVTPATYPQLNTVIVTFHLWRCTFPGTVFGCIPSLETELNGDAETVTVSGDPLSITTERASTTMQPLTWSCTWLFLTEREEFWVSLMLYSGYHSIEQISWLLG